MTAEGDLTEAVAWRVLDQVADEARKEVVKQGLKEDQLDSLIEESLLWARSLGKTAAQHALFLMYNSPMLGKAKSRSEEVPRSNVIVPVGK